MDILAFDTGDDIVGILDMCTSVYAPYRGERVIEGANRLIDCKGIIISFNGTCYDLPRLAALLGAEQFDMLRLQGTHCDMSREASIDRWRPDPGTEPILGTDLRSHYEHYIGSAIPDPPTSVNGGYEQDNWRDCFMAGRLWKEICAEKA